jgi:hypothetical protein
MVMNGTLPTVVFVTPETGHPESNKFEKDRTSSGCRAAFHGISRNFKQ